MGLLPEFEADLQGVVYLYPMQFLIPGVGHADLLRIWVVQVGMTPSNSLLLALAKSTLQSLGIEFDHRGGLTRAIGFRPLNFPSSLALAAGVPAADQSLGDSRPTW